MNTDNMAYKKVEIICLKFSKQINNLKFKKWCFQDFPGGAVVENLPANAGDTGPSPGLGGSHMPRSN